MTQSVLTAARLARDPVLPRRDELLDPVVVRARLEHLGVAAGSGGIRSCTRVRARYRRGESLRTTYRVTDDRGTRLVSARMFTADRATTKLAQARDAARGRGAPRGSVLVDDLLHTVFWVFPEDRKLSGLTELVAPSAAIADIFGEPWTRSELLAYTPEKAATARCEGAGGGTVGFAKVQVGDEGRRSIATLQAVRRGLPPDAPLHVPDAIAYLPDRHMALLSAAPGVPLHQLARTQVPDAMAALGTALAVLHRQPTEGFPPFNRLDPDRLSLAAQLVAEARPDVAPVVKRLVAVLRSAAPSGEQRVLVHGDLHPKNVLVHEAGVSLVDLDQAGAGPAAAELGGALARLWCPRPGDAITADTATASAGALLAAYAGPSGSPSDLACADLLWYAAAALLVERAARAVSRVDLATLADLEQVLAAALRWATASSKDRKNRT